MKSHGKTRALAMGIALGFGLMAGGMQAVMAAPAASKSASQSGQVLRATLDNGLRVVIVRDALAPVVATQITYLAGGYDAPKGFPGTAHALEHMMFRDSKGMSGAQLHKITGKMGAGMNAFTTEDATQYYFVAPSQYVDTLLKIESLRMRGAALTEAGWDLEKGAIEQEVSRDISNPGYLASAKAREVLFAGTGYAAGALGSRPSFDKTTGALLQKFYNRWYQPNNAILVIAGDVNPHVVMTKVKQLFGPIPKGNVPAQAPFSPQPIKPQTIRKTTPSGTGSVEYVYRVPGKQSEDYAAMKVLLSVFDNARSDLSSLQAKGKVLSAGAGLRPFVHGSMGSISAGFPKGGNSRKVAVEIDRVINHVLEHGVSPDLVAAAKRKAKARFEFARNSVSGLASAWSSALAWAGLDSPHEALQRMERVTVADVNRVARKYLRPDRRVTVVMTPSGNGKRPPHSKGFGGTESFASKTKLDVPLPEWAERQLTKLEMPNWTLDPVRMVLDNGITLIVQPESISKTVVVAGFVHTKESLQAPEGHDGVEPLLEKLFHYGTTHLDRKAFHKALDEIAASEAAGGNFYLSVLSEHFDRGMQLLADHELHPALPEKAFKVKQKALARRLKGKMQSPRYKTQRALLKGLLPAGDPRLRHATPATVKSLSLADVKRYYHKTFRPDMTTIVVVGDVTPAQAKAKVEKYFGDWKASGPKPDVQYQPIPLNKASYAVVDNSYASQDAVLMAQALDVNLDDPDRYALELGNAVLGGYGFSSRLMTDIRVKHGYAYGASSFLRFGRTRSTFYIRYASDPDKVDAVDKLIHKNVQAMRTESVTAGELANARQALIRSIPRELASFGGIASTLLSNSYKGLPLNEPMIAARHYLDLDAEEVQAAFEKYIHPDHLVQVVTGPKPESH